MFKRVVGLALLALLPLLGLAFAWLWLGPWRDVGPPPQAGAWPVPPPRVVLVLGAGGPRAFAHVGVLKALEELRIVPDGVVGASAGALIGALWLGGRNATEIELMADNLPVWRWLDLAHDGSLRVRGDRLALWLQDETAHARIESLARPFAAVATDTADGQSVAFTHGSLGWAVQASSATRSLMAPVRVGIGLQEHHFVDADQSSPVPVRAAKQLGAQRVIAVDVSARLEATPAAVPESWRVGDRLTRERTDAQTPLADVLIHVDLGYYAGASKEYRRFAIDTGYAATMAQAERLRALLGGS